MVENDEMAIEIHSCTFFVNVTHAISTQHSSVQQWKCQSE